MRRQPCLQSGIFVRLARSFQSIASGTMSWWLQRQRFWFGTLVHGYKKNAKKILEIIIWNKVILLPDGKSWHLGSEFFSQWKREFHSHTSTFLKNFSHENFPKKLRDSHTKTYPSMAQHSFFLIIFVPNRLAPVILNTFLSSSFLAMCYLMFLNSKLKKKTFINKKPFQKKLNQNLPNGDWEPPAKPRPLPDWIFLKLSVTPPKFATPIFSKDPLRGVEVLLTTPMLSETLIELPLLRCDNASNLWKRNFQIISLVQTNFRTKNPPEIIKFWQ